MALRVRLLATVGAHAGSSSDGDGTATAGAAAALPRKAPARDFPWTPKVERARRGRSGKRAKAGERKGGAGCRRGYKPASVDAAEAVHSLEPTRVPRAVEPERERAPGSPSASGSPAARPTSLQNKRERRRGAGVRCCRSVALT